MSLQMGFWLGILIGFIVGVAVTGVCLAAIIQIATPNKTTRGKI